MKKILVSSTIIVLILLGLGSWYVLELVKQRTNESANLLLKRAVYRSSRLTDYLDNFPVDAEYFIKKNDVGQLLSSDEVDSGLYWETQSFYTKYQAVLDGITITSNQSSRVISGNKLDTFTISDIGSSMDSIIRFKDKFQREENIVYIYPIFNHSEQLIANVRFELNVKRFLKHELQSQAIDRADWLLAMQDNNIFEGFSMSPLYRDNAKIELVSSHQNLKHAGQIIINKHATILCGNNKVSVIYAYNPVNLLQTDYGIVVATERAGVLSVVTRLTVIISLIFLIIIVMTILVFYKLIKTIRKEEIEMARISSAVDNANDLVLITLTDFQSIYANKSFLTRTLGTPSMDKLLSLITEPKQLAEMKQAISENGEWFSEVDVPTLGKIKMPCLIRANVIKDQSQAIIGILFIATDITQRKRSEKIKSEFISTVSHELRTPLTSIRGSLGLIKGGVAGEIPASMTRLVDIAYTNSERLIRLINDILDIEKIEAGGMEFHLEKTELLPEISRAIGLVSSYATQFNVSIELIHSIPGIEVMIDKDRFEQVMNNLLSNASKFSATGSTIEVEMLWMDSFIRINVRDFGIGIPEEFRGMMFKKFAQVDSSDTRSKGGTGLGLSISKAIIEKLGGRIDYESQVNLGTTFFVDLPIYRTHDNASSIHSNSNETKILIVEDDIDIASLINIVFTNAGYKTDIAYSAEDAKEKLKTNTYSLISLDLLLPQQQGISFIRELREHEVTASIPIVVVSAVADKQKKELHGGFGVVDWISKPIDMNRLQTAVQTSLCGNSSVNKTILYIEDDEDNLLIVQELLKDKAHMLSARTVAEAKQVITSEMPDLIIMDLNLPDGNGLDIIAFMHQTGKQSIPVVLFSAYDIPAETSKDVALSLVKSKTTNEELIQLINKLLSESQHSNKVD